MPNPFYFRELPLEAPFCDRHTELKELVSHAKNRANMLIFSPRRYGKTSLVKRVQDILSREGVQTVYIDFIAVNSIEDIAGRLANKLYTYCHKNETLLKKATRVLSMWRFVMRPDEEMGISLSVEPTVRTRGFELLEETLTGFGRFMKDLDKTFNIVIDEFQEITELKDSHKIEGVMREHIQTHSNASYFFVGSRRRVLQDIFNQKKRAFYQSAINYPIAPLPHDDAVEFIVGQFKKGGKELRREIAGRVVERIRGYPYYVQRIPYSIFECSGKRIVTEEDYTGGFAKAIDEEKLVFEAMLRALAPTQIKLLGAFAEQATGKPFAAEYIARFSLGSVGTIQGAMKKLISLDYIELENGVYRIVDPVFGIWLRHLKG